MNAHSHPDSPRLRFRAFTLGCGVFLLFAGITLQLADFVSVHQNRERVAELEQDSFAIKHRLEAGLAERVTLMRQAASFWQHSDNVTREHFKGYALRLLAEKPLFFNISFSGPDFKLRWAEPEEMTRAVIGLDHQGFPDRYPGMNPREITDAVRIGAPYKLVAAQKMGFCIIAPIFSEERFEGFLTGTVVLDDLFKQTLSEPTRGARHIRLVDARWGKRVLYDAGVPLDSEAVAYHNKISVLNLEWGLEVWSQPELRPILRTPHEIILLSGLLTAAILSLSLGIMWLGKQRLRDSEASLRKHFADLEHANTQSEEAIAKLETANSQLETTNTQLETANQQLAEKNTELATVNLELETANLQLRDLNKELDDFNHVVSHDLKEPLRGIQAFSQFLLEDYSEKLDDMGRSYLENLMSSASRMQQLINDLMQLARVTKSRSSAQAVDMNQVMRNALQDLYYAVQSRKAEMVVPDDLPPVWGDPTHLLIVVKNLVSNALKYNDKPVPKVELRWYDRGQMIEFQLEDNGIGIDPRFHRKVFELFERLVTQEAYEGTGAGLAISRKIIEQHGGTIWVESVPGKGSTFHFTLPKVDFGWSLNTNPRILLNPQASSPSVPIR